jgi:predicted GIY-YIG superfamily endonuclease
MSTKAWFVYIALLEDGRFYVGMTKVLPEERAHRHLRGTGGTFTKASRVVGVLWSEQHVDGKSARQRELQLKKWSHAKKQALINGDLARLKSLARSRRRQ